MDPDRLAELEEERRFLLGSLADLEREHEVGDVEEVDYHALRDGYTARAAVVLRNIEQGRAAFAPRAPRNWLKLVGLGVAVLTVALVAGWLVARSSGQRLPGDTITGGTSPDRTAVLLSEARSLLGSDPAGASQRYLEVLSIDPNNAEAHTYTGWLLAISTQNQSKADAAATLTVAKQDLQRAIEIDPTFPDPHCFLAVIAARFESDTATAKVRAQECLANNPPADMRGMIEAFANNLDTTVVSVPELTAPSTTG
jgi:hypothetical protein